LLGTDVGVVVDGTHTERAKKGGKLSGTGCQSGKIWGGVSNVNDNGVLDIGREAIVILVNQVKAPEMDTGGEKGNE
jgi:hypothetical protein